MSSLVRDPDPNYVARHRAEGFTDSPVSKRFAGTVAGVTASIIGLGLVISLTGIGSPAMGPAGPTSVATGSPVSASPAPAIDWVPEPPSTVSSGSPLDTAPAWTISPSQEMTDGLLGFLTGLRDRGADILTTNDEHTIALANRTCTEELSERQQRTMWAEMFPSITVDQATQIVDWVNQHCGDK